MDEARPPGGHRRHAGAPSPHPRRRGHRLRIGLQGPGRGGLPGLGDDRAVPLHRRPGLGSTDGAGTGAEDHRAATGRPMSRIKAYAQLLRIPNVFTAMADVCMGWMALRAVAPSALHLVVAKPVRFATAQEPHPEPVSITLRTPLEYLLYFLGASACLYCAGMVLNDYFDVEQDRR